MGTVDGPQRYPPSITHHTSTPLARTTNIRAGHPTIVQVSPSHLPSWNWVLPFLDNDMKLLIVIVGGSTTINLKGARRHEGEHQQRNEKGPSSGRRSEANMDSNRSLHWRISPEFRAGFVWYELDGQPSHDSKHHFWDRGAAGGPHNHRAINGYDLDDVIGGQCWAALP